MSGPSAEDLRERIAELDAEIELLAIGHRSLNQASIEALERAEQAEAEVKRLTDLNAQYADRAIENGQRADTAEAARLMQVAAAERWEAEAERAEAERDRLKDLNAKLKATIDAFPDANSAANLAHARRERDQLRAAAERVRAAAQAAKPGLTAPPIDCSNACFSGACDCSANWRPVSWDLDPAAILAALDQAPAAEQDGGGQ